MEGSLMMRMRCPECKRKGCYKSVDLDGAEQLKCNYCGALFENPFKVVE